MGGRIVSADLVEAGSWPIQRGDAGALAQGIVVTLFPTANDGRGAGKAVAIGIVGAGEDLTVRGDQAHHRILPIIPRADPTIHRRILPIILRRVTTSSPLAGVRVTGGRKNVAAHPRCLGLAYGSGIPGGGFSSGGGEFS